MRVRQAFPLGVPVGRALTILPGIANDDLRDAVAAIDRVHGDGDLPPIPMMVVRNLPDDRGRSLDAMFVSRKVDGSAPIASAILIRSGAAHRSFVAIHEVGHFIDLCGLPGSDVSSPSEAILSGWRTAVIGSRAYQELERLSGAWGDRADERAAGLLAVEELWARSYAQFVATRSDSPPLLLALDAIRGPAPDALYYPRHWDDDDFAPIDAAIEGLFRGLRWIA